MESPGKRKKGQQSLPLGYTERNLIEQASEIEAAYQIRSAADPMLFIKGLVIPSASGPRLFNGVIADFQLAAFRALAPSLVAVRDGNIPGRRRFWLERTKKAGKDSDLAILLCWLMAYSVRPVLVQVVASDQDQAAIIKRRVEDILFLNPWLKERVRVVQNKIKGYNGIGEVVIEATDSSGGAHGETPDLLILNELVHVRRWSVMETHMNNADGVPRGVVIVSTNAGIRGSKAEVWRKTAIADQDRWTVLVYDGVAPWINKNDVEEARKRDPVGAEFARLWRGRWVSGSGGAVEEHVISNCFCLPGPTMVAEPGWVYVAGLDLGVTHDHAGIAVLGINELLGRIKVCVVKGFVPSIPNNHGVLEVDSQAVEKECVRFFRLFGISWFGYDPAAGGSFMAQRLRKLAVPMSEVSFSSPKNKTEMATSFVQALRDGKLECYEDSEGRIRRDFGKFNIIPQVPTGYKLEAISDEYGHADVGTALIICLPVAMRMVGGSATGLLPTDDMFGDEGDGIDLTKDEVKELPNELKDIWDSVEDTPKRSSSFSFEDDW